VHFSGITCRIKNGEISCECHAPCIRENLRRNYTDDNQGCGMTKNAVSWQDRDDISRLFS